MKTQLYPVRQELAVQLTIIQKSDHVTANIRIIAVTKLGQRLSVEGIADGPYEEFAICSAFEKAYAGSNATPFDQSEPKTVIAKDRETLVKALALAYGIPQLGNKISVPL